MYRRRILACRVSNSRRPRHDVMSDDHSRNSPREASVVLPAEHAAEIARRVALLTRDEPFVEDDEPDVPEPTLDMPGVDGRNALLAALFQAGTANTECPEPILVDYREAARLLGCTVTALKKRVARGQVPGIVRTGRRTQFHVDRLRRIK